MSPETEALRRCERLLGLMAEAMRMERVIDERARGADASMRSLLMPILEQALARLEPLRAGLGDSMPVQQWLRELVDLELELDAVLARRGWRVLSIDAEPSSDGALAPG